MGRSIVFILIFILMASALVIRPVAAENSPQSVFNIEMMIQVDASGMAHFTVYAVLKDPYYRAYFSRIAANNTTRARDEFKDFVRQLVYTNLKDDFNNKLAVQGLNSTIYLPAGGPVSLLKNWSAVVSFDMTNFLVGSKRTLRCPVYGPLNFVFRGHVFSYRWSKLTLILPTEYNIENLAPAPNELADHVAVWKGGDFIPLIQLTSGEVSVMKFLNETHKTIVLSYNPNQGYLQFTANFSGANASDTVKTLLLDAFRGTMHPVSMSGRIEGDQLIIVGVTHPQVKYSESLTEKQWEVMVRLPGSFNEITVKGGKYKLVSPTLVLIRVTKRRTTPYLYGALTITFVSALVVFLVKGRRKKEKGSREGVNVDADSISPEDNEGGE